MAAAEGFVYEFREVFTGTPPESTPPWITSQFLTSGPGSVELTVTANLIGSENLRYLYLNLNDSYNPRHLDFQVLGGTGAFSNPAFTTGKNAFRAGGDGYYDVLLSFATDNSDLLLFTGGDSIRIGITGIDGLSAYDFAFLSKSAGGFGPFYGAAHVQRIGAGSDSGWLYPESGPLTFPVPEPGSGLLFGAAGAIMMARRFWKARH